MLNIARKPKPAVSEEPIAINPDEPRGMALLSTLHPRWRQCSDRLAELMKRKDNLIAELQPLELRLLKSRSRNSLTGQFGFDPPKPPAPTDHPEAVRRVLGDELTPAYTPSESPTPGPESLDLARYKKMRAEMADIDVALPVLQAELKRAHKEGSRVVCDHVSQEYEDKVAGPLLDLIVALGNAMVAHDEFEHAFRNVNTIGLRPLSIAEFLGDIKDHASPLRQILTFAKHCGHFDQELPASWSEKK